MSAAPRLRALSVKLALVLFGVVAVALAIVYLVVVPRLESRLVDAKIAELRRAAPAAAAAIGATKEARYPDVAAFLAANANARVVVFDRLTPSSLLPLADSSLVSSKDVQGDPVALRAAETGLLESGRVRREGREYAEVAARTRAGEVVLLSAPLTDALANVRLVRRSLVIAALVALLASGLVGYVAAWGITRRLRRLEAAAGRIAAGDFGAPVVDHGRDEVGQLARAFDSMRVRLSHLEAARREFIQNASHELRTPLSSLGGFLELMTDEELDEETRREFLAEMRAQVERLTRLAADLLDLSRLDAGQLEIERGEIDLAAVARTVTDEFRPLAETSDHELRFADGVPVFALADEQRVFQIARVLVENALRHTPAGTAVAVVTAERDGRATLAVRDAGPGIAADEQARLFERFYRGGAKASGSGLGLAIASELARMMDGSLTLTSEPGDTVATLQLPVSNADVFSRENDAFPR